VFSDRDRTRLQDDVRARVIWGDSVEDIRTDWLNKKAPAPDIKAALQSALRERNAHFRARGIRDFVLGLACFVVGAVAVILFQSAAGGKIQLAPKEGALVLIGMAAAPAAGIAFAIRGVRRILTGGKSELSASDLD